MNIYWIFYVAEYIYFIRIHNKQNTAMEDNSGGGNFSHYRSFLNAYNQMEQLVSTYISLYK